MEVIPAIDILDGQCVRLFQGDYQRSEIVGDDPIVMARHWADSGAPRLHVVDLSGARDGQLAHLELIATLVRAVACPVQVGGGIRTLDHMDALLAQGVDRVIVGTLALEDPDLVATACARYPGRIWVALDSRGGKLATHGWLAQSEIDALTVAQRLEERGVAGFIYTDILQDGTLLGPNVPELRRVSDGLTRPVLASGGMGSLADLLRLLALESSGVRGAILGQALYKGTIQLKEALRAVGNPRWQDVPLQDTYYC
ncbi:1-(5-phosphoribosyl)-5-[(5-phosphoribosylamino)methylideneamino]imidazole-4-carboxamide isomerase [Anthocerotibacter panamensis]|uniref:1-(5-phosphoribosyl)-5-[(5- phosphoribosylamino)methylideneamino]imidazole-4- carboxamide isomerase n=1 Tax=Anthocerotibacter panamensis TaxID=2857077 RepID=UPI001C402D9B|nr:1-(5-phosphoribosyl)-5-[(5-phosphoribosylamino)methylideneamino]imidazole-4-carboxamide isomerase [Anthocerotibacter panamensis]